MKITELYEHYLKSAGINTDSRTIQKGELFFAVRGEKMDGNKFASDALRKGAALAIIDDPKQSDIEGTLLVDNALHTLQELASFHRQKLRATVIAITGSNGKTTTKELIKRVLKKKYKTFVTPGNLNNHIGLPLSLLQVNPDTEYVVLEFGANHAGENAILARISDPDTGIITNIGKDHLEGFGSPEGVKKANGELFDYLRENQGNALVNNDDPNVVDLASGLTNKSYGHESNKETWYAGATVKENPTLVLSVSREGQALNEAWTIQTQLFGYFHFSNVMAAVATGRYFGVDKADINQAIKSYKPDNNRTQLIDTKKNTILLDAYNANPTSVEQMLRSFTNAHHSYPKMVILGDMYELGEYSDKEHKRIAEQLKASFEGIVILIGKAFGKWKSLAGATHFDTQEQAKEWLKRTPQEGRFILIKGSRKMALEELCEYL